MIIPHDFFSVSLEHLQVICKERKKTPQNIGDKIACYRFLSSFLRKKTICYYTIIMQKKIINKNKEDKQYE